MKAEKVEQVCKNCGFFTTQHPCPNCKEDTFVEKYKGVVYILDIKSSHIAKKLNAQKHGKYAIKY